MEIIQTIHTKIRSRTFIKIAIIVLVLLFACMLVFLILYFLQTGKLVVTTKNKETIITVNSTKENINGVTVQESKGKLSSRLKPGNYYIKVTDGDSSKTKYITIQARKTIQTEVDPVAANTSEPVVSEGSFSIAANNNQLIFLNDGGYIKSINTNNDINLLSSNIFKSVKWADPNYGIAQDSNNNLFLINNGVFSQLVVPEGIVKSTYSISISNNRHIYLWTNNNAYSINNGTFSTIFNTPNKLIINVLPSSGNIAVITSEIPNKEIKNHKAGDSLEQDYTINILNNSNVVATKNEEMYEAAISKDGGYFAITSDEGTEIFNSKLEGEFLLPDTNVNNMIWRNDTELLYSVDNKLVAYNVGTKESYNLTTAPNGPISYIAISEDSQNIYYVSEKPNYELSMSRVGFEPKDIQPFITNAQYLLPKTFTDPFCYVSYINFTRPTIEMTVQPSNSAASECKTKTTEYLKQYDLNPGNYYYSTKLVVDD